MIMRLGIVAAVFALLVRASGLDEDDGNDHKDELILFGNMVAALAISIFKL